MSGNHEDHASTPGPQPYWQPGQPPQATYPPQSYAQPPSPQQTWAPATSSPQPQLFGYGQQPSGPPVQPVWVPPVPRYRYARWLRRAGGYLIDFTPAYLAQIPFWIGYVMFSVRLIQLSRAPSTTSSEDLFADLTGSALRWMILGVVLMLAAIGWQWYNRWLIGGRTGQSMGRRVMKTKLVAEVNGQPIGAVNAFLRDLLHVLDGAAYIGFLWPLWDEKRQTFADMIMKTVVIDLRGQPDPNAVAAQGDRPGGPA